MQAAVKGYVEEEVLYIAMELSQRRWRLGFSNGDKIRQKSIEARNRGAFLEQVALARSKLRLSGAARVVICYEAGRDGHWIYRWLDSEGFEVLEIDSSSIETAQGRKHVKTDRVDVEKLLDLLIRHCIGRHKAFRVVRVPSEEAEAVMRLSREDEYLIRQRNRISNRIKGLLVKEGVSEVVLGQDFAVWLESLTLWHGKGLSTQLKTELLRLHAQYQLANDQIKEVAAEYVAELADSESVVGQKRYQLELMKSIGPKSSRILSAEIFAWRTFKNTKQVGAMSGLTPTPYQSGDYSRERGISKSGLRRVRRVMIELAWLWLRWQPDSALSRWFNVRFAGGGKRMRRIGIVALARKLLIALWKYVEHGVIPEGAVLKSATA